MTRLTAKLRLRVLPFFSLGQSHHAVEVPQFAGALILVPRDVPHQHLAFLERLDADRAHILFAHSLTLLVSATGRAGRSCAKLFFRPLSLQQRHLFTVLLANSVPWMLAAGVVGRPSPCASLPIVWTVRLPILASPVGT